MSKPFTKIVDFINSVSEVHREKYKPLKLYEHLLSKVLPEHSLIVEKNVELFRAFCTENREAILAKNENGFGKSSVKYSNSVHIDIRHILSISDGPTKNSIWQHLLVILACFTENTGEIKEIISRDSNREADFIASIMNKMETSMTNGGSPADLLSSGLLTDISSTLSSGNFDPAKLMGAVKGLLGNLEKEAGDDTEAKSTLSMMSGLINNIESGDTSSVDLSTIMGMMSKRG